MFREIAGGLSFPEGPVVLPGGTVLVCEVGRGRVSEVDPATGRVTTFAEVGGGANGAAMGPDGAIYVCNNGGVALELRAGIAAPVGRPDGWTGGGIQRIDVTTREVTGLYGSWDDHPLQHPNDLVFDARGDLWFTDSSSGSLYRARADGTRIELVASGIPAANGVGLAPDGLTLYVVTSVSGCIWAWQLGDSGAVVGGGDGPGGARLLWDYGGSPVFDSMAVEDDGALCVATLQPVGGAGSIAVFRPDGSLLEEHTLPGPDAFVTNICFGGDDMRTAYVTSGGTGKLFVAEWPRPGLALAY